MRTEFCAIRRSPTWGYWLRNRVTRSTWNRCGALLNVPSATVPPVSVRIGCTAAAASSAAATVRSACGRNVRPASVSTS